MFNKLLVTVALISAAAAVAGLGTFATFTSTTSAAQGNLTAGTVAIGLGTVGPANRLTLGASSIMPGDTMQRAVDLVNTSLAGVDALSAITLDTVAAPSNLLTTDVSNGLQMAIDKCSVAWTEAGVSPAFTYTCGGTTKTRAGEPSRGRSSAGAVQPGLADLGHDRPSAGDADPARDRAEHDAGAEHGDHLHVHRNTAGRYCQVGGRA